MARLKILTYNLHKGFSSANRRFVLHRMRKALAAADVDVVFLQEALGEHQRHAERIHGWPDDSQVEFLADSVWSHFAYGKNAIYNHGHHGNAILSKYPFVSWENIDVSPYPFAASRSILHGVIEVPGAGLPVHIVCIHFGLLHLERRTQIDRLCHRIASHVPEDEPLVVAGDFNDWFGRAEHHFHSDLDLREVFMTLNGRHARSFPSWAPFLPMDRIYYRGVEPVVCERLDHPPWRTLSDHAPLRAWFEL